MKEQVLSRTDGERRAQGALIRLLCAVSVWRTAMTRVLPLCGASAWWTVLLCLLPGFGAAALLRLLMHITHTGTLAEALRVSLGSVGIAVGAAVLPLVLMLEGVSSMTALMTLFTQGIGTRGTQLTLAVLTGVILLLSLHREGLARGVYFLRWGMVGTALLAAGFLAGDGHIDHLFPLYGDGRAYIWQGLRAGVSLAWPMVLLLTVEPSGGRCRLKDGILPAFGAVGAVLLLTLATPHEFLRQCDGVAEHLLLPVRFVPNAVRVIAQSLMMLVLFFGIGAAAQMAASSVCLPLRKSPDWLPYVLVGALILTQTAQGDALWELLGIVSPWLLAPLLVLAVLGLIAALCRRKIR